MGLLGSSDQRDHREAAWDCTAQRGGRKASWAEGTASAKPHTWSARNTPGGLTESKGSARGSPDCHGPLEPLEGSRGDLGLGRIPLASLKGKEGTPAPRVGMGRVVVGALRLLKTLMLGKIEGRRRGRQRM